jgi:hypothetical protein
MYIILILINIINMIANQLLRLVKKILSSKIASTKKNINLRRLSYNNLSTFSTIGQSRFYKPKEPVI